MAAESVPPMFRKFRTVVYQFGESFSYSIRSIVVHKLRTVLSLLGITIGIFSIISVYTFIDSMESYLRENMSSLGSNTIYVDRMEWDISGSEYEWWKIMNRPVISYRNFQQLQSNLESARYISYTMTVWNKTVKYGNDFFTTYLLGVTDDYDLVSGLTVEEGRFISPTEYTTGARVAVLGNTVAEELFHGEYPINKIVKVGNLNVTVVGVIKKVGVSINENFDETVIIPLHFARSLIEEQYASPYIVLKGRDEVPVSELKDDITIQMRKIRRLRPAETNNFGVNEIGIITGMLDDMFGTVNLAGGIIGMFAILVGGFGIANIMFVSVRERMAEIGIQKALGAKSYYILMQFLYEAILLSLAGGALGLLLVWTATLVISAQMDFPVALTAKNILIGFGISAAVGAASGFIPAYSAAKMDPIKAIFKV